VVYWMDDTRTFGTLRPRVHDSEGSR
jgi:hypothetical protein